MVLDSTQKRLRYFIVCTVVLLLLVFPKYYVHADALLNSASCIRGPNTDEMPQVITVRTVGNVCYNKCQDYCAKYFKVDFSNFLSSNLDSKALNQQNMTGVRSEMINVNRDNVDACLMSCYNDGKLSNGIQFRSDVRIPLQRSSDGTVTNDNGNSPYPWGCSYPVDDRRITTAKNASELSCDEPDKKKQSYAITGTTCSPNELNIPFYDGKVSLQNDDNVTIRLVSSNSGDITDTNTVVEAPTNDIYLCGFKTMIFTPEFRTFDGIKSGGFGVNNWQPTNRNATPTGIYVKDGDYLSIDYMGRYHSKCGSKDCSYVAQDYNLSIYAGSKDIYSTGQVVEYGVMDYPKTLKEEYGKRMQAACDKCNDPTNPDDTACKICIPQKIEIPDVYGLKTTISSIDTPKVFTTIMTGSSANKPDSDIAFRQYNIYGTLKGLTSDPKQLYIRHPNANSNSRGGYYVSVTWRGCHYQNGERLQYTIFNEAITKSPRFDEYLKNDELWSNVPFNDKREITLKVNNLSIPDFFQNDDYVKKPEDDKNSKGRIYFRIKTLTQDEVNNKYVDANRYNTLGEYYLNVERVGKSSGDIFNQVIEKFSNLVKNIPETVFKGIIDSDGKKVIQVLLIFYIAFTGLSFMIGLAPITQQEGVIRIFKISVVLMLISENSWEFFNNYFLGFFNETMMKYWTNLFTLTITEKDYECVTQDSLTLLCMMGGDLKSTLLSTTFWMRIGGLFFSGFFVSAIVIIIGVIMYSVVIIKITILYCLALLGMAVVLSLAPIFISLILFKYTKTFFDAWIKQLLVLLLQPLFIFTAMSLFRKIFMYLVDVTMGFLACKTCFLDFELPFGHQCLFGFYLYVPVSIASSGPFSLVMTQLTNMLAMFFVGYGMYSFCNFAASMGQRLIKFNAMSINEGNAGNIRSVYGNFKSFGSSVYNVMTSPLDILAIDDDSRARRKAAREKRRRDN